MAAGDDRSPAAPRRGRPGHDQAAVLRRAIELFNTRGYDATSMGDLAAELGIGKSTLYHHVPSKAHLLAAALDEALETLEAALDEAGRTDGPPGERLADVVRRSVRILVDHLPAVTLLLRVRGNSELELAALARRRALDERLAGLVRAAADVGVVRTDVPPEVVSRLLFGMVNSLVEWYRPGGALDPDTLADAVTTLAFDGLRPLAREDPSNGG